MPNHEIKTRFRLEGEQQYRSAMKDAADAIKVLNAEEKLAKAQFEETGDAQQYAADQASILKEKIEEQKKIVEAAESAVRDLTEKGFAQNSKEMQTWRTKLINANTALSKMETKLRDTESELRDQSSVLNKAKNAMSGAETKVKSLTAEEKLAEAQFKNTGDKEAYAADKTRILKEKVEAQKVAVSAAEEAIKSMTDNGVDPASAEMVEWKEKLADAKTKLATMETALADAEKELKDQTGELGNAKTAMANAETKIKSLTAEEKLAEAQFKATGDKEAYAAEKTRILKEKVEAQKKAVEAAEKAIKSMTDNGVDPNAEEMVEWKNKLVEAKTKLANMETALNSVGTELGEETEAFGEATGGADDLKKSIDKVGEKVDYQNVISAIDDLSGHIESVVKAAGRMAKAVWNFGQDAASWADEIATAAAQLNVDPETYQSWQYASNFIDTSVDDITRSWQDIQKNLKENNTEYMGELAKLRVGVRTTNGTMRSSEDIFWDLIDAIHNIKDPTEQARVATQFFGNDWRKLKPLIDSGSKAYKDLAAEGKNVAVVSNENVEKLGKVDDAMQKLKAQANKLKNDALAALSPSFIEVSEAGGKAVTALQEFLESAEGKAAVDELNNAVSELLKVFLGDDNGKGTFKAVIDTAKEAVKGFNEGLKWIADNGETVKTIIAGMGIVWGGLKVSKGVLEFMTLLQAIPLDKLLAVFSSKGAESVASAAGKAAGKAAGGAAAKSFASSGAAPSLAGALGAASLGAVPVAGAGALGYIIHVSSNESAAATKGAHDVQDIVLAEDAIETGTNEILSAYRAIEGARQALVDATGSGGISEEKIREVTETDAFKQAMAFLGMKDINWLEEWKNGGFSRLIGANGYGGLMGDMQDILYDMAEDAALQATLGLIDGAESGQKDVEEVGKGLGSQLITGAMEELDEHSPSKVFEIIGGNAAVGLANGIYDRADEAIRAAQWLADEVAATFQNALDIHSPSGVFEDFGEFTGIGYAGGVEKSIARVEQAVGKMVSAATNRPIRMLGGMPYGATAYGASAQAAGRSASGVSPSDMLHVTIQVDGEDLADIMAPLINGKIGAMVQATKR